MTESFQKDLDTCSWTVGRPPPVHSCSCTRVSLCRAREGRRFGFAGRGSGPARRCRGGELLGPGSRFPRAEPRWALRVNLSSGSRGSGGSSRRRRARRGPGGCRRTAAVPGPPPHDRSAASGSRAPLMPCRGSWRVKEGAWVRQRARVPLLRRRNKLGPSVGSDHCSGTAHFSPSGYCCGSCLPEVARSGRRSVRLVPFILSSPRLPPGFLLPSAPLPAQPSPLRLRSPPSWRSRTSISQISKPISHPVPLGWVLPILPW